MTRDLLRSVVAVGGVTFGWRKHTHGAPGLLVAAPLCTSFRHTPPIPSHRTAADFSFPCPSRPGYTHAHNVWSLGTTAEVSSLCFVIVRNGSKALFSNRLGLSICVGGLALKQGSRRRTPSVHSHDPTSRTPIYRLAGALLTCSSRCCASNLSYRVNWSSLNLSVTKDLSLSCDA